MADNIEIASAPVVGTAVAETKPKKTSSVAAAPKKQRTAPIHPSTAQMVDAAITSLKERSGSSLLAIKKYLTANYKVDADKLGPFIKKYLKTSVVSGKLVQTRGKGASGSFKLSPAKPKTEDANARNKKKKSSAAFGGGVKKPLKKSVGKKIAAAGGKKNKTNVTRKAATEKKKIAKTNAVESNTPKRKSTKQQKPKTSSPKKSSAAAGLKKTTSKK